MLAASRTRWAEAGLLKLPNSSRSPPLRKPGPSPRRITRAMEGSAAARASPSRVTDSQGPVQGVAHVGAVQGEREEEVAVAFHL